MVYCSDGSKPGMFGTLLASRRSALESVLLLFIYSGFLSQPQA